jgi:PD-(D/E)XK nuclease superfamily
MTVKYNWSYSSLSLFKQCPHKYYRLRVVKDVTDPPAEHLNYGLEVHKAAEEYIRDGKPIPQKYAFVKPHLDKLNAIQGEKLCEEKLGLTRNIEPCGFFDKEVWWRGVADLIIINEDKAYIIDYKTGKSAKYADTQQLEILSLAVFKHFPQVKKVKGGLLFVVADDLIKANYEQDNQGVYWSKWLEDTQRLEAAILNDVWNKKPNFSCRAWCAVTDCEHNGRSH